MWFVFSCLRGDGDMFFLLRAFFRLPVVEWFVVLGVVVEEEETLMDEDDGTRLTFGILRGSISFCSSSLSSSPDSYKILSKDILEISLCIASERVIFWLLFLSSRDNNSLRMARLTTIDLFASSKPILCLLIASNISVSVGLQSGPFPRFSSFNNAKVARSLEYPHRLIRAPMPVRTAVANSVLARIASETLSRDGIVMACVYCWVVVLIYYAEFFIVVDLIMLWLSWVMDRCRR